MRIKQPDRHRSRAVGAVDERMTIFARKPPMSGIALAVGTPLLWAVADDIVMPTSFNTQATFTDRMGVSWATSSGCDPFFQLTGAMGGRNAWKTGDDQAASSLNIAMDCAAVTVANDFTWYIVIRNLNKPVAGISVCFRQTTSGAFGSNFDGTNFNFGVGATSIGIALNHGQAYVFAGRTSATAMELFMNGASVAGPTTIPPPASSERIEATA